MLRLLVWEEFQPRCEHRFPVKKITTDLGSRAWGLLWAPVVDGPDQLLVARQTAR